MANVSGSVNGFVNPNDYSNCTVDTCPILTSFYNYRIDLVPNAVFAAIFVLSYLTYISIYIFTRRGFTGLFFMLAMGSGIACEVVGYFGRIVSYQNQWDQDGFLMQIVCLTIAPAFFSAAIYLCLGRIVEIYGKEYSRLPPSWYTRIFIPCDVISMVLQGAGAAVASVALTSNKSLATGDNVMIAGLATQVFTMFVFIALGVDFALRVRRHKRAGRGEHNFPKDLQNTWRFRCFLVALAIATICVFWRSVFRVAELNSGWTGPLTYKQNLFIGFEGVMMVITVVSLALFHPAICMGNAMNGVGSHNSARNDDEMTVFNEEVGKGSAEDEADGQNTNTNPNVDGGRTDSTGYIDEESLEVRPLGKEKDGREKTEQGSRNGVENFQT